MSRTRRLGGATCRKRRSEFGVANAADSEESPPVGLANEVCVRVRKRRAADATRTMTEMEMSLPSSPTRIDLMGGIAASSTGAPVPQ